MEKSVNIAGGGPAGLACGIRLLERGWSVSVREKGRYPLKKVCGEFLSPAAWRRFTDLGAAKHLRRPPRPLRRARFYADASSFVEFDLAPHAFGLRRAALDSALAARFRELGGSLQEGSTADPGSGAGLELDARGRGVESKDGPWIAWKGFLAPADAPRELDRADLLMLPLDRGYAGLSWVEDGSVSACLIARRGQDIPVLLKSHPVLASVAPKLCAHASIAGFSLRSHRGAGLTGDRRRVWPPLVGDGIQRALASGEALALGLDGETRRFWDPAPVQFWFALGLHYCMMNPWLRRRAFATLRFRPRLAGSLYQWTRL